MACISDIKLIRTDTTLDLSQKAEKGMSTQPIAGSLYMFFLITMDISPYGSLSSYYKKNL